jgi:dTDP-4-dehydrorhamnose 3,5-epimerase-like enzyme
MRWDDPKFDIDWPLPTIAVVSDADRAQPTFAAATGG